MVSVATSLVSMTMFETSVPLRKVLIAEVGVARLAGAGVAHGGAKISVAVADGDDRGIVAVDGDGRRGVVRRRGGRILRHGF